MRIIQEAPGIDEKITYEPILGSMPRPTFLKIIYLARKLGKDIEVIWNEVPITISRDSNISTAMQEYHKKYNK